VLQKGWHVPSVRKVFALELAEGVYIVPACGCAGDFALENLEFSPAKFRQDVCHLRTLIGLLLSF
jgi:hypothetical protein